MSIASVAVVRVVGVIDLKDGMAVHAVRGERERYRPVHSVITADDGDPVALTRAFRSELGLDEVYVADLDAITGAGEHRDVIAALAREASVMVDAGVSEPGAARALVELGVQRVIVGTETLPGPDALERLLAEIPQLVLSVDLRDGRLLSPDPQLAGLPALDALARLHRPGLREVIVLDLARVGSGAGTDVELFAELHAAFDVQLLAGGGVRDVADLRALRDAGAAGALVATALHKGVIGPRELAELSPGG
jgi:phosphoribosylformimino-5-aminoimidazole carboxamide ribotide isomerase